MGAPELAKVRGGNESPENILKKELQRNWLTEDPDEDNSYRYYLKLPEDIKAAINEYLED